MSKSIDIRMYNVGFGDCFLIRLPEGQTILVDAGFHSKGKGDFSGDELATQVVEDVTVSGAARIDVVIATHRHQDHVYSFNSEIWDDVEIGEVWLPWVEDRASDTATKLWKKQQRFAQTLAAAMTSFNLARDVEDSVDFMLWNAGIDTPASMAASGTWTNKKALDRLHEGFARRDRKRPRFLPTTKRFPETFETKVLPGVAVHVLGPPRDPDMIKELDPDADGETYRALRLRGMAGSAAAQALADDAPFGVQWQVAPNEEVDFLKLGELERLEVLAQGADPMLAASTLDDIINSTSLVLVLEIGKAKLLLPGDAEWGTWKFILENDDARELLEDCTFFKVGHHGSHNATSPTLVEEVLSRNIPAMIATQEGDDSYRNNIPLGGLITALKEHGMRCARSDKRRAALPRGFTRGPGGKWIDVKVPC